jgi:hypothetical protein
MVFGINSMLVVVMVRHSDAHAVAGFGTSVTFLAAAGTGSFLGTVATPAMVRRWGRYGAANGALGFAAAIQLCGTSLHVPLMLVCGFLLGAAGQVVKLCADTAMQIDVDDALRGHVFTVQDALFWMSFIVALALAAAVIPPDGRQPLLAVAGVLIYLVGLGVHAALGRRGQR